MADQSVALKSGEWFRRRELAHRLHSLAGLIVDAGLPVHRFDRSPVLEFQLATEAEVDHVARALGQTPKRFKDEYFTGIENAELRVRWTAHVGADDDLFGEPPGMCSAHGPHPHEHAGGACLDCQACVDGLGAPESVSESR